MLSFTVTQYILKTVDKSLYYFIVSMYIKIIDIYHKINYKIFKIYFK